MSSSSTTITLPTGIDTRANLNVRPEKPTKIREDIASPSLSDAIDIEMLPMPGRNSSTQRHDHLSSLPPGENTTRFTDHISGQVQTVWNPYKNRFRLLAACLSVFGNGMNDAAAGALISSIEITYAINYGIVSTIFVCNALGFLVAASFLNSMTTKIGRSKSLIVSSTLLMIAYAVLATTPPFPAVAFAYFVSGLGMAINLAICQVFCANLANNTAIIGIYQGSYGIGGVLGPLIATALLSQGYIWSRFYIVLLGLAVLNIVISPWAFWNYELESNQSMLMDENERNIGNGFTSKLKSNWVALRTLLTDRPTLLGSVFTFTYQGAEVAISGWVISFLVQFRHGDPSKVGYVTSGFWAGITVGRFTLSFVAHAFGERNFVFLLTALALILELLIWFVPSVLGDSIAIALSGLVLGPVSPCSIHIYQRIIPRKMHISSLSLIGSLGSTGGAIAPFMTGMIAQYTGTYVLHPICIGLFLSMAVSWWALPSTQKRDL